MTNKLERQAAHFSQMLSELGFKSDREFGRQLGLGKTSVSDWKLGKVRMTEASAKLINKEYPQYSVEWLRGETEARTAEELFEENWNKENKRLDNLYKAVTLLAMQGGGFNISEPQTKMIDGWPEFFFEVTKGKKSITLTGEQYSNFINEIAAYVEMRLSAMLERGCW